MKAQELRIGNWVESFKNKVQVVAIESLTIWHKRIKYKSGAYSDYSGAIPSKIKPIPITPEWLEKFGFVKRLINGHIPEYYIEATPPNYKEGRDHRLYFRCGMLKDTPKNQIDEFGWYPLFGGTSHRFPCKYVHQLQNLYFAITGKELEIKEKVSG